MHLPLFLLLLLYPLDAFAYLDPGTGSVLLQVLLAMVAGVAVVVRIFWGSVLRFWALIRGRSSPTPKPAAKSPEGDAPPS